MRAVAAHLAHMRHFSSINITILICLALGVGAALASVLIARPYTAAVGNLCERTPSNPGGSCFAERPRGGFPFSFLYDRPGVSVENQLGLEDEILIWALALNIVFYTAHALFFALMLRFRSRKRRTDR